MSGQDRKDCKQRNTLLSLFRKQDDEFFGAAMKAWHASPATSASGKMTGAPKRTQGMSTDAGRNMVGPKEPVRLELYASDIPRIMRAFYYFKKAEVGLTDDEVKMLWIIRMQLRKQGYDIQTKPVYGYDIVRRKRNEQTRS